MENPNLYFEDSDFLFLKTVLLFCFATVKLFLLIILTIKQSRSENSKTIFPSHGIFFGKLRC